MANRFTFTNDTITAGKFVELGRNTADLRARLQRLNQMQSVNDNSSSLAGIGQMASDNVITPDEKAIIAQEWEHIKSAYNSTVAMIESLGVDPQEFESFKAAYASLASLMESILSDMDSPSNVGDQFRTILNAYNSAATILQNWVNAYQNSVTSDISSYRLEIKRTPPSPTLDSTIIFSAYIYIDGVDRTADLMNTYMDPQTGLYPTLFNWIVSGTKDDEGLMGRIKGSRTFSVSASDFVNDNISVYFSSELEVG